LLGTGGRSTGFLTKNETVKRRGGTIYLEKRKKQKTKRDASCSFIPLGRLCRLYKKKLRKQRVKAVAKDLIPYRSKKKSS